MATRKGAVELLYVQVRPKAGTTTVGRATDGNGQTIARGFLDVHPASDVAQRVSIEGGRRAKYRLDIPLRAHGGSHSGRKSREHVGVRMLNLVL